MTVYLDNCALSRLTDDQTQERIREEAEAVERVLAGVRRGSIDLISSEALEDEIRRNPSMERRAEAEVFLSLASLRVEVNDAIVDRAGILSRCGYGPYDALHLASAEAASADVLLTTDDALPETRRAWVGASSNSRSESGILDSGARSMIATDHLTDEEFERQALDVLLRELGPDGLARFLRLTRSGSGDYTRDRQEWQKTLTLDDILASIRGRRQQDR